MSNVDPDLQPKEKNLPIAIDVVDGNLIVKRHNGKEESFPFGSGFNDGQVLYWDTLITALADDVASSPVTQDDTSIYGPDGEVILEIHGSDLVSAGISGLSVGEDFIIQRSGGDVLWFKTPGLYVVQIEGPFFEGITVQADYSSNHPARTAHWQGVSNADGPPRGTMTLVVGAMDVATDDPAPPHDPLHTGATFSTYVYNHSGSVQDISVILSIMRVG